MPSDRIVTARLVLQAQLELQRLGHRRVLSLLESREPDLMEYVIEATTMYYHQLLDIGVTGKQARRLHHAAEAIALTCMLALQKAHAALWQDDAEEPRPFPPGPAPPADGLQ